MARTISKTEGVRTLHPIAVASLLASVTFAFGCGDDTAPGGGGGGGGGGVCELQKLPDDEAEPPPISTPRWAFRPWISKDISTGDDSRAFVQGFLDRDIPVGVLVLDSPWETNYNTLVPNPERYPEFGTMVSDFRELGVRTVLWTTQMINTGSYDLEATGDFYESASPDYAHFAECDWFVDESTIYPWWKGQGSAIDFFDADARAAWHRLQDPLFEMGVAGFKLDFGESYIENDAIATAEGVKSLQEYSEAYYRDFYAYGSARAGQAEFVTMVRPYDKSYQFEGRFFALPEHAPVAWVGDNRRDYFGMQDALDHIMRSADAGYVVVGSDIGGYLDRDDQDLLTTIPFDPEVFMRWVGMGAMMPFMQLHGRANLEPWAVPEMATEVTESYRFWATLHDELVPFFDSVAVAAYAGGEVRMLDPVAAEADWADDYRYWLGGAFLVVPVLDGSGARDIEIPSDARYFDLLDDNALPIEPGTLLSDVDVSDARRIPVFAREGAIIPMEIGSPLTGFGTAASSGALTLLVYPAAVASSFDVVLDDDSIELTVEAETGTGLASVALGARDRTLLLRVRIDAVPAAVLLGGAPAPAVADRAAFDAADEGFFIDGPHVWVKVSAGAADSLVIE